jgi:hypothetical protein
MEMKGRSAEYAMMCWKVSFNVNKLIQYLKTKQGSLADRSADFFRERRKLFFIVLKNTSPWPGFEPATFGSSGQHTNHYTTKTTCFYQQWSFFGNLITAIGEGLFNFSCARPKLSFTSVVCPAGHRCHTYAV